jgi:hypothetical protein
MADITLLLIMAAIGLNGILAGASLDQSIKQLPARRRIGVIAYSTYAKAADLGNGIIWYAVLGVGAAIVTIGTALAVWIQGADATQVWPLYLAALLSLAHSLVTTQAAPTMFSQRRHGHDEAALTEIFNRLERWHALRAFLQVLTFAAVLWALINYCR